ncbi:MAG: hypothetical protein ACFB0G_21905 [Leptolyngbyaceae cyanobacterium]
MPKIINFHVLDKKNVGDLLSSPLRYFDFPGYDCEERDLRTVNTQDIKDAHVIIGGGGLLFKRFLPNIEAVHTDKGCGQHIFWGVGQQSYQLTQKISFDYKPYTSNSDLVGVRDDNMIHPWVPCVSCMHPSFDKSRTAMHEFVIFSHKKFQINIPGIPRITNEESDFDKVLDFLGSGKTILTSSFHGAYWGTLLGRKVLAFPFSSKFFTFRHQPELYPVKKWSRNRWKFSILGKTLYSLDYKGEKLACDISNWREHARKIQSFPNSLQECRSRNQWFYESVMTALDAKKHNDSC